VQKKVEPVKRPNKPSPEKHAQFFKEVRRPVRSKAEGEAEKNDGGPGKLIKQVCHLRSPFWNKLREDGCNDQNHDQGIKRREKAKTVCHESGYHHTYAANAEGKADHDT
jgi:hypothetical protein